MSYSRFWKLLSTNPIENPNWGTQLGILARKKSTWFKETERPSSNMDGKS